MAFKQYTLLITGGGSAVRLSDAYGDGTGVVNPRNDVPFRQLFLQAHPSNGTAIYIGDGDLTAPDNSAFVLQPGVNQPQLVTLGPFETGPIKLSDLWAVGLSGGNPRLLISGVPF
jgi:hypothetical protein